MARVADFTTVINNHPRHITDIEIDFPFSTYGRIGGTTQEDEDAFLIFNVKGLMADTPVKVNGSVIGTLFSHPSRDQHAWHTQTLWMPGNLLKSRGNNMLELEASPADPYFLKNVVCFFHQKT